MALLFFGPFTLTTAEHSYVWHGFHHSYHSLIMESTEADQSQRWPLLNMMPGRRIQLNMAAFLYPWHPCHHSNSLSVIGHLFIRERVDGSEKVCERCPYRQHTPKGIRKGLWLFLLFSRCSLLWKGYSGAQLLGRGHKASHSGIHQGGPLPSWKLEPHEGMDDQPPPTIVGEREGTHAITPKT